MKRRNKEMINMMINRNQLKEEVDHRIKRLLQLEKTILIIIIKRKIVKVDQDLKISQNLD